MNEKQMFGDSPRVLLSEGERAEFLGQLINVLSLHSEEYELVILEAITLRLTARDVEMSDRSNPGHSEWASAIRILPDKFYFFNAQFEGSREACIVQKEDITADYFQYWRPSADDIVLVDSNSWQCCVLRHYGTLFSGNINRSLESAQTDELVQLSDLCRRRAELYKAYLDRKRM